MNRFLAAFLAWSLPAGSEASGTVTCWGYDGFRQTVVPSGLTQVVDLKIGWEHACAATALGTVSCWGRDKDRETEPPAALPAVQAVSAGAYHSCALTQASGVECWGRDNNGQATVPAALGSGVVKVASGGDHNCAITAALTVTCWGENGRGQATVPAGIVDAADLALGLEHSCALSLTGSSAVVTCWGYNNNGETNVPAGLTNAVNISARGTHTCALTALKTAVCWGDDRYGQSSVPSGLPDLVEVAAGAYHSCVVTAAGATLCWGRNGIDDRESDPPSGLAATQLSLGAHYSCAVTSQETVECWGRNSNGVTSGVPQGLSGVVDLAAGEFHNCAVTKDNGGVCWGHNEREQATLPATVKSGLLFIGAGSEHTCALDTLRSVFCWGRDANGEGSVPTISGTVSSLAVGGFHNCVLNTAGAVQCWGQSSRGQISVPGSLAAAEAISAGTFHTCALLVGGTVECWGRNSDGQSTVPGGLSGVTAISAGGFHTCALTTAGTVTCWGKNSDSQATPPPGLQDVTAISASQYHTCAVTRARETICWGYNNRGQIDVPAYATDTEVVAAGWWHTCIVNGSAVFTTTTSTQTVMALATSLTTTTVATTGMGADASTMIVSTAAAVSTATSSSMAMVATASMGADASTMIASTAAMGTTATTVSTATMVGTTAEAVTSKMGTSTSNLDIGASAIMTSTAAATAVPAPMTSTAVASGVSTSDMSAGTVATTSPPSSAGGATLASTDASSPHATSTAITEHTTATETASSTGTVTTREPGPATSTRQATPMTTPQEPLPGLVRSISSALQDLGNASSLQQSAPQGELEAARVSAAADVAGGKRVSFQKSGMEVLLPQSLLESVEPSEREELVLVVTVLDGNPASNDDSLQTLGATSLDLGYRSGRILHVEDLPTPILFSLPVNYTTGMRCAFWENGDWSSEGLEVSKTSALGAPIVCATTHLTVFAAIYEGFVSTFECSQISLLNSDAIAEILQGRWYANAGAILCWILLSILTLTFATAAYLDWQRSKWFTWTTDFFLLPLDRVPHREDSIVQAPASLWCVCCPTAAASLTCLKETALRNAVDEILSNWFAHFADLRSFLESIWEGLDISTIFACDVAAMKQHLSIRLLSVSARHLAATSTGLSDEVIKFVLEDEDFSHVISELKSREQEEEMAESTPCPTDPWLVRALTSDRRKDSAVWKVAGSREAAWKALQDEVTQNLPQHVSRHSWRALPSVMLDHFRGMNPVSTTLNISIFASCKMRALLLIVEISGSLMVTCLFFTATGTVTGRRSSAKCQDEDLKRQLSYQVGRVLAIAVGAVVTSWIPVTFLGSLRTIGFKKFEREGSPEWRKQLRIWEVQNILVWVCGSVYAACCLFFTVTFLANISIGDHNQFTLTAAVSFVQDSVVLPLGLALLLPLAAQLFLSCHLAREEMDQVALIRRVYREIQTGRGQSQTMRDQSTTRVFDI